MTTSSTPPSDAGFAELSQILKSSGDNLRLEILRALAQDSFGVLELCQLFEAKQSGMSHHLKVLSNAQLVTTRKEGNSIFYRRKPTNSSDAFAALREALFRSIDSLPLSEASQRNLAVIYHQRAQASKSFFSENINRFKQQQDLIASYEVYGSHVQEALRNAALPSYEVALEIGPGTGEFLLPLCKLFAHTTALDTSVQMLAESQKRCEQHQCNNIDFIHNDTRYCRDFPNSVDCAVINMVLHHTPSPQQIFDDVAHALKPGGVVIICDLCEHNQDWTREACGDLWLGFAPEDLSYWAANASMKEGHSSYFALRNGFQIQVREFIKLL